MNWYRAKTVLIILFILTNIFLFYNIVFSGKNNFYISDDIIKYTVSVLENNGITINSEIIPRKKFSAHQFEADNIIESYDEFAKNVLGEDCVKISDILYESAAGTVEYNGDKFTITANSENITENFADEKDAVSFLKNFGIHISDFEYNQGTFEKKVDNLCVFNSELSVIQSENGTVISGVWFEKNSKSISSSNEMKPITSVLIDFISDENRPQGNIEITGLEWGYMVYDTENYHKSIVPVPVWKITLADGSYVYMDARAN